MRLLKNYKIFSGSDHKNGRVTLWLTVITVAIFLLDEIMRLVFKFSFVNVLGLRRNDIINLSGFYQVVTYQFMHGSFFHLFFNMLILWMFGKDLEFKLGSKRFLFLYLVSGIGGGLAHIIFYQVPVIGASGSIFALLLSYAVFWPNRQVLVLFVFPVKIKYLVIILGVSQFLFASRGSVHSTTAYLAHIGGLLTGGIILLFFSREKFNVVIEEQKKKRKLTKHRALIERRIREKDRVDLLLDKISESGMKSLTVSERSFLKKASSKYYDE